MVDAFASRTVNAQSALTDGGNHDGTILLFQTNTWTFTATNGDLIALRVGRLSTTNSFNPWMRLYDSNGLLIAGSPSESTQLADELALTIANAGTFTLRLSDGSAGGFDGTGTYRLHFFKFPGPFIVSDDGGSLISGGHHDGTIPVGDLDPWTFTATNGERIVLRSARLTAANSFNPWVRLYVRLVF